MSKVLEHSRGGPEARVELTRSPEDRLLRYSAGAFIVAVAIHGADHAHRGAGILTPQVRWGGLIQLVLGAFAVGLVMRRHRWAAIAAMVVGFASALLFSSAHLLPTWGAFSDPYLTPAAGADVSWFSWVTALLEVGADLLFGWAGLNAVLRTRAAA